MLMEMEQSIFKNSAKCWRGFDCILKICYINPLYIYKWRNCNLYSGISIAPSTASDYLLTLKSTLHSSPKPKPNTQSNSKPKIVTINKSKDKPRSIDFSREEVHIHIFSRHSSSLLVWSLKHLQGISHWHSWSLPIATPKVLWGKVFPQNCPPHCWSSHW